MASAFFFLYLGTNNDDLSDIEMPDFSDLEQDTDKNSDKKSDKNSDSDIGGSQSTSKDKGN